jgi:hypothetical protein
MRTATNRVATLKGVVGLMVGWSIETRAPDILRPWGMDQSAVMADRAPC